jgi:hypothetical protein
MTSIRGLITNRHLISLKESNNLFLGKRRNIMNLTLEEFRRTGILTLWFMSMLLAFVTGCATIINLIYKKEELK